MLSESTSLSMVFGATRRAARLLSGFGFAALLAMGSAACIVETDEAPGATDEPTDCNSDVAPEDFAQAIAARDSYINQTAAASSTSGPPMVNMPVVFHVLHKHDGTGMVEQEALEKQVEQLNDAFSGGEAKAKGYAKATDTNIRFSFHSVEYVDNDEYHDLCALTSYQDKIKKELAVDPSKYLNVYVCHVVALGLAWLPYQAYKSAWTKEVWNPLPENHYFHGVLVHWELLPGSTVKNGRWAQGDVLTHEVGHYFGLKHAYEGDCYGTEADSDGINDTPRQKGNPQLSCQQMKGTDSCPGKPGKDDYANYMGITWDTCRSHFTPGQVDFMRSTIAAYKPSLLK